MLGTYQCEATGRHNQQFLAEHFGCQNPTHPIHVTVRISKTFYMSEMCTQKLLVEFITSKY